MGFLVGGSDLRSGLNRRGDDARARCSTAHFLPLQYQLEEREQWLSNFAQSSLFLGINRLEPALAAAAAATAAQCTALAAPE